MEPLVDAPVFPYASEVRASELPDQVPYRVAQVKKYYGRWEMYVDAPLARETAHALSVVLEVTNRTFDEPGAPRTVLIEVYSHDPTPSLDRLLTPVPVRSKTDIAKMESFDPDAAEAFASNDQRGFNGNGTWDGNAFYAFTTPFGDGPFRDEGKVYATIPHDQWTSVELFAIDRN